MKQLTAINVMEVFMDCLFQEGEDTSKAVIVDGIISKFGFHPGRLESHKQDIREMLDALPEEFQESSAAQGTSFLQGCVTRTGDQWGEHQQMEQLFALGFATKDAVLLMPREFWKVLPGGMPYIAIRKQS
jgi:hypothetical protein